MAINPFEALVSGGLGAYQQMEKLGLAKQAAARQQQAAAQQSQLQNILMQQQQQKLEQMPQEFAAEQEFKKHQIATARMSEKEATHKFMMNRFADLNYLPKDQVSSHYQDLRKEALELGVPSNELPEKYDEKVASLAQMAAMRSPEAAAQRKFMNDLLLKKLDVEGKIDLEKHKGLAKHTTGMPEGQLVGTSYIVDEAAQPPGMAPAAPGMEPTAQAAPQAPPPAPALRLMPSPEAQKAYAAASGKQFAEVQKKASETAGKAAEAVDNIDTFMREAPKIAFGTGPIAGMWPFTAFDPHGNVAKKAQNALALNLLQLQKFGRVTNKEMQIVQDATLNLHMTPEAITRLGPQLRAIAQRNIEYSKFLNAATNVGIRNISQVDSIWHKFLEENPVIDNRTGQVNQNNIGNWQKYLSPQMLRGELQTPVYVPKDFVYPGSPQAQKQAQRGQ